MSNEEIENMVETLEKWDAKHARQNFLHKMERKLYRKEKLNRR